MAHYTVSSCVSKFSVSKRTDGTTDFHVGGLVFCTHGDVMTSAVYNTLRDALTEGNVPWHVVVDAIEALGAKRV